MMQAYRTEGNYRSAARLSPAELRAAMANREILQATALAFDTQRQLRFEIGGVRAVMPFAQCADGAANGTVRDIAVLTRVGRPTCFVIEALDTDENGQPFYRLSRALAQQMCKADYLDTLQPGDILPCTVTHIEPFGAFCDVGCGISALLPIDCMSVSRISSPADRVSVGQQILCAVKNRDVQGRFVLTIRELLGTWEENAAGFTVGETVVGIVRSVEEYGTFIEIAPNLACDDFPHQRKSQAYAAVFSASGFIHTKEGLKNTFSVLFGDAVTCIRNRNNKLIVFVRYGNIHCTVKTVVAYSVFGQIV